MKIQPPSRKTILKEILMREGKVLTVDKLSSLSGIPVVKLRQTLTTWEFEIVRVAPKTYDLAERIYIGKTFRHTPEKIEVKNKILQTEDDIHLFLTSAHDYNADITLVDELNNYYHLHRIIHSQKYKFSYFEGINKWFRRIEFEYGDDMLFTCISLSDHKFFIKREKKKDRDEFKITVKNKKLADLIYNILSYTFTKYEDILFLFRKYLYVYPFNDPIPPDHISKALFNDKRFLLTKRDKLLSWTGHYIKDFRNIIGLRKFYFKNSDGFYVPVLIEKDEFGRYGFCSQCNERMVWKEGVGWRHTRSDLEWSEVYLPLRFFKIENGSDLN